MLTDAKAHFDQDGFVVARGLFSPTEAQDLTDHYMRLREERAYPGDFSGVGDLPSDPLKQFPRMIHMHRWDERSLQWLLEPRLYQWMTALLGTAPFAVQTMLYFKPPGARGQALHQDQHYLKVEPGTCLAAWMALDPCDEENGCLQVVPGTQDLPLLCTEKADTSASFTDVTVPLPETMQPVPVVMAPGDVLFFNGQLIHGSFPNTSKTRFRRSLIGHYIVGEAEKVGRFYQPALRQDGSVVTLGESEGAGACGQWVDKDGAPVVELVGN